MAVPLIVVMHAKLVSHIVLWLLHCNIHHYSYNLTTTYWDCICLQLISQNVANWYVWKCHWSPEDAIGCHRNGCIHLAPANIWNCAQYIYLLLAEMNTRPAPISQVRTCIEHTGPKEFFFHIQLLRNELWYTNCTQINARMTTKGNVERVRH